MCEFVQKLLKSLIFMRVITLFSISALLIMYISPEKYIKITVSSPLYSNNVYIDKFIVDSEIDYIGVFEYNFSIEGPVNTIQRMCSYKKDFCIKQDNDIIQYELSNHIMNKCYYIKNFHNIGSYISCPIIVSTQLRGYAVVGSSDIMIQSEIEYYSRSIAESISLNTQF